MSAVDRTRSAALAELEEKDRARRYADAEHLLVGGPPGFLEFPGYCVPPELATNVIWAVTG